MCFLSLREFCPNRMILSNATFANIYIGVGTGGGAGGPSPFPPQYFKYFTLKTLLIFMHAAQIAVIAVYIMFGPPKIDLLLTPHISPVTL